MGDEERLDRLIAAEQDERRRIALFLHDGPVQNLAGHRADARRGAALDRDRQARRRPERARRRRSSGSGRRSASSATSPSRSSRSCCATRGSAPRSRRSPSRSATAHQIRIDLDDRRGRAARRDGAGRALHDHPRAARPGGAPRARRPASRSRWPRPPDGGLETVVADDAEPERRRRSLEAVEERVKQLHGTIERRARTTRARASR